MRAWIKGMVAGGALLAVMFLASQVMTAYGQGWCPPKKDPKANSGWGTKPGDGVSKEPKKEESQLAKSISEEVKLRYFYEKEIGGTKVKENLEKVSGVTGVAIDERDHAITLKWTGALKDISKLESACASGGVQAAVVSHALLKLSISSSKLEDAKAAMAGLSGVKAIDVKTGSGEMIVDLEAFDFEAFRSQGDPFKVTCKSHERCVVTLKGDKYDDLGKELAGTNGVISCSVDSGKSQAVCVTRKTVSTESFKKVATKVGMTCEDVKRM